MPMRRIAILSVNLAIICLLSLTGANSSASEDEIAIGHRYRAVRALGMGDAFAAIADDGDAFYYNPAGLANVKGVRVDIQPLKFIPTQDLFDNLTNLEQLIDDVNAIGESENPLEDPDLEDERLRLTNKMESLLTENLGLDAAAPARIIVPLHIGDYSVSIGGIAHGWSESQVFVQRRGLDWDDFVKGMLDDEVYYNIMAEASYGCAAAMEFPIPTLPLELSLGFTAKRIHRWQMTDADDPLGIVDILNPYGKDGIEGTADDFAKRYFDPEDPLASVIRSKGYSVDLGSMVSIGEAVSLALVVQNAIGKVGEETLSRNIGISAAANLAKIPSPDIPTLDIIVAAGLDKDDEMWEEEGILDKTRLGLEIIWDIRLLAISGRIGSNHGYMTMGAGIQLMFLDFDYAFYGDHRTNWHAFSLNMSF